MAGVGRAAQFSGMAAALMAGVGLGRFGLDVSLQFWIVAGLAGLVTMMVHARLGFVVLICAILLFGIWRWNQTIFAKTTLGQKVGQTVTLTGTIIDDPGETTKSQIAFTLGSVRMDGRRIVQKVGIRTSYKTLRRGFKVAVSGKLKEGLGATRGQLGFGQVEVLSTKTSWLEDFRGQFFIGIRNVMPEPMAGFGLGLLVGVRSLIDKPLQDILAAVGLSHLIAVSGYNLTIMVQAVHRILQKLSLFVSTAVSLWLIFGFLLVAGFGASIVRAAMVSVLGILTAYYGYEISPMTLIALPALITVVFNPDYLISDLGWQLSFLAFAGILILAPAVEARWIGRPNAVKSLFIESTCAQITTLPLIMWKFGLLSVISPLSNMVTLPMVPLAMLLTFICGLAGAVGLGLAAVLALPATGLLALMIAVIEWFNSWPFASLHIGLSGQAAWLIYATIALMTLILNWKIGAIKLRQSLLAGTIMPGE